MSSERRLDSCRLPLQGRGRASPLANDEDVAGRVVHDLRRDRAEEDAAGEVRAARTDDDQVGARLPGRLDDSVRRVAVGLDRLRGDAFPGEQRARLGQLLPAPRYLLRA